MKRALTTAPHGTCNVGRIQNENAPTYKLLENQKFV